MPCGNNNIPFGSILADCSPVDIGCLPLTDGIPTEAPASDEVPIRVDTNTGSLWVYHCNMNDNDGTWLEVPVQTTNCDLTAINQAAVDAATLVQVSACVDDQNVLIPYVPPADPFVLCDLPAINQAAVDAATLIQIAACVDGVDNLIPLPTTDLVVCDLPAIDQTAVDAATLVQMVACVDGVDNLIPVAPPGALNSGTYFPVLRDNSVTGVFAYAQQEGFYTVVGGYVLFDIYITGNWTTPPSGEIQVTLPSPIEVGRDVVVKNLEHSDISPDSNLVATGIGLQDHLTLNVYGVGGAFIPVTDADQQSPINQLVIQGRYRGTV